MVQDSLWPKLLPVILTKWDRLQTSARQWSGGSRSVEPGGQMDRHCQPETLRDAHYSRHIRAGMTILKFDDPNTLLPGSSEYALDIYPNFVVAYDKTSKVLVIVATNLGEAETITFDLSTLASADGPINTWTTEPNATAGAVYKTSSLDNFSAKVPGFQQTFQLNRS